MSNNTFNTAVLLSLFRTEHQAHIVVTCTDYDLPTTSHCSTNDDFLVPFMFSNESACARIPRPKGMIRRRRNDEVLFRRVHQEVRNGILQTNQHRHTQKHKSKYDE
jgi:hypothetical protein